MAFTLVRYSQRDPQWKDDVLGFDGSCTLGTDGCVITSLTMLVDGYGGSETPSTLNAKMQSLGGNGFIGAAVVWYGIHSLFPSQLSAPRFIPCRNSPPPLNEIDDSLALGQPVIVELDSSPAAGLQNHWVVLYAKQGSDYLMLDPWPYPPDSGPVNLTGRYGFSRPVTDFITNIVIYRPSAGGGGTTTPPSQVTVTPPANYAESNLYVEVMASASAGLRLRSEPNTSSVTLSYAMPATRLRVMEKEMEARAKLGVDGKWLFVRDPQGLLGYVAAWLVQLAGAAQPPATTPPTTPDVPLSVRVSTQVGTAGLRLRTLPSLAGGTVKVLKAGAALEVLEPSASAKPKVGMVNQWLNVRDGTGATGYVAAWLVTLSTDGPVAAPSEPVSRPTELVVVVSYSVGSAGLRMRASASLAANIVANEPPGTRLTVLENATSAQTKIGISNQWLNVRDPQGRSGYVAAWLVVR